MPGKPLKSGMAFRIPLAAALEVALGAASVAWAVSCTGSPLPGIALPVAVATEVGTWDSLEEDAALLP